MYYKYSEYLKDIFGTKIYKLSVNLPITCPNHIHGTSCKFCADIGIGFEAIDTRRECIQDEYLQFLKQLSDKNKIAITIELGLQTVNYHTLSQINRGHTLSVFSNLNTNWWKLNNDFEEEMKQFESYQGKQYNYSNGSALCRGGYLHEQSK